MFRGDRKSDIFVDLSSKAHLVTAKEIAPPDVATRQLEDDHDDLDRFDNNTLYRDLVLSRRR